ncbi:hypothetical protein SDC9_85754 [bioreactor metagenome]|uniref:Uncharacterized protein n=1 Tax=bioreactor metagenome TaxID=1076179 RepID=A0A644ZE18_9ZZZZ
MDIGRQMTDTVGAFQHFRLVLLHPQHRHDAGAAGERIDARDRQVPVLAHLLVDVVGDGATAAVHVGDDVRVRQGSVFGDEDRRGGEGVVAKDPDLLAQFGGQPFGGLARGIEEHLGVDLDLLTREQDVGVILLFGGQHTEIVVEDLHFHR